MVKFQAVVELEGKTATGIEVPAEVVDALGKGKRVPVVVTIGSYSYRSTIASMGGRFLLPLSAEHRAGAGVAAGDAIEVGIEVDTEVRRVAVPDDLQAALAVEPAANGYFGKLSNSNKSRIVLSVEGAKTAETRQRRIEKAIDALREGRVP